MECISCIKDGNTGICRDIKDKTARELIEDLKITISVLQDTINTISGVEGGHLATDQDIALVNTNLQSLSSSVARAIGEVQGQVNSLSEKVTTLENEGGNTEQLTTLETAVSDLQTTINNLDNTYAKDSDITALQNTTSDLYTGLSRTLGQLGQTVTGLQTTINNLDTTYAKDSDITSLQSQVNEVVTGLNQVIEAVNNLDTTYAKDTDITTLQEQITSINNDLELSLPATYEALSNFDTRITTLESAGGGGSQKLVYEFNTTLCSSVSFTDNSNTIGVLNKTSFPKKASGSVNTIDFSEMFSNINSSSIVIVRLNNKNYIATEVGSNNLSLTKISAGVFDEFTITYMSYTQKFTATYTEYSGTGVGTITSTLNSITVIN